MNAVAPAVALVLLAWATHAQQQEPPTAGLATQAEFVETDCVKWVGRPRGVHVDCGYVSVPEDRSEPDGSVIRLAVARLRASVPAPHPDPVIYLAGGAGESTLQRLYWLIDDTRFIWAERELVIIDLRGTGRSEPSLECPDYRRKKTELLKLDLHPDEVLRREVDALLACKRSLTDQGIDVGAYSPDAVAADVADLAAAMGYEAYNLYGTSFGTLLALTVMRDFPEDLRAVVLDGVWPPQVNASESRHANAASALQALFRRCEAEPDCAERYPELEQDLWEMVRIHDVSRFTIWEYDWDSRKSFEIEVDGHFMLRRVLESLRSTSWIPYVPFLLHRIADRDRDVAREFARRHPSTKPGPVGNSAAWASLLCSAEGRFSDSAGILADRAAHPRLVDPAAPDLIPALCAAWHAPTAKTADRTPVNGDVPTLLLSGELDPTTPPRWAEQAAKTLSRGYSFVVPSGGHGVGMDTPCGRALTGAFLDAPSTDPSPACSSTVARMSSGFRTLFLFQPVGRGPSILWRRDHTGTNDDTPTQSVPRPAAVLGILFVMVLHLSALVVWPVSAMVRRFRSGPATSVPRPGYARMVAAAVIALSVGFWWSVRAAQEVLIMLLTMGLPAWLGRPLFYALRAPDELRWLTDEVARGFGYYSWVLPLFYVPYLTAAASVYVLYLATRSWRKRWWTGLGRVHYSLVAIALAWYPFHLVYSGYFLHFGG